MKPQNSVVSELKEHALFLSIRLNSNLKLDSLKNIGTCVDRLKCEYCCEILHGIGLGMDLCKKLGIDEQFEFIGPKISLPKTEADLFVHAKCDLLGVLFELAMMIVGGFGEANVVWFEDVYGFKFRRNCDLSGFIDGINNPSEAADRMMVGVRAGGASFCVTQRWEHDFGVLNDSRNQLVLSDWIGRRRDDGDELYEKTETSHVAKMKGGNAYKQKPKYRILRQSMPYGQLSSKSGLFFIAYSKSIESFNFMLNQLVGGPEGKDGRDDVMKISQPVTGNYWFFPSAEQIDKLTST